MEEKEKEEIREEVPEAAAAETAAAEAEETAESPKEESDSARSKRLKAENRKLKLAVEESAKALAEAEKRIAELTDTYMRVCAEYENFRKRSAKEKEETYAAATGDSLIQMLPLMDNLSRAAAYTEGDKVVEGVHMILDSFPGVLEKMNVTAFGEKGEPFDPNFHNAIMQVQDPEAKEGTVAEVFQRGYRYRDRILRHAMVSVYCK